MAAHKQKPQHKRTKHQNWYLTFECREKYEWLTHFWHIDNGFITTKNMISYGFLYFSISDHKQGIREYEEIAREAKNERERKGDNERTWQYAPERLRTKHFISAWFQQWTFLEEWQFENVQSNTRWSKKRWSHIKFVISLQVLQHFIKIDCVTMPFELYSFSRSFQCIRIIFTVNLMIVSYVFNRIYKS